MLSINRLYEYLAESKSEIERIKSIKLVVDDSEIVNELDAHKESDNMILMGVIPIYDTSGSNDDAITHNNYLMFLVLEKTNYSKFKNQDERVSMWNRTHEVIKEFEEKLISDKSDSEDGKCPELKDLDVRSIRIEPVWKLGGCNGWMLTATVES